MHKAALMTSKTPVTIDLTEQRDSLIDVHGRFMQERAGTAAAWVKSLRSAAMERFNDTGFPTTRDEEWRFTNVAAIAKTSFALPGTARKPLSNGTVRSLNIPNLPGPVFVFVDGQFAPQLSSRAEGSVRVTTLRQAIETHQDRIRSLLEQWPIAQQDAFTNLNTAFLEEGAFILVSKGVVIDEPIHLLCITTRHESPIMSHPRNIILADESSQAAIIEHYVALDDGATAPYLTNAVTDIVIGENANVHHYLLERESAHAFNISTLRARQHRHSQFASHTVLLGGKLVRNNVHAILDGEGCTCLINGLYVPSDDQHMDNHMRVEHAKPYGDSRQFYKGILNDRATAVFSGRIIVHPGAQKTDAKQTNKNLLLSDQAQVDTKPQLEIYADDVKCTHGATIGQLDEEAIFYLRARGIHEDGARSLLIHAFAGESLGRMNIASVRNYLDKILLRRLPGGELLENAE
jgi:Fe-S cluster assembly protein SufD